MLFHVMAVYCVCLSPQPPKEPEKEAEWADEESEVVHLTDTSFDDFMAANPSVLVMFYAPCKSLDLANR